MSKSTYNQTEYKKRNIQIWNEVAPRYHKRWASTNAGPFQSTTKLVKIAGIKNGDTVLDVACGTGTVTRKISSIVGKNGRVIGVDTSINAVKVAKSWIKQNQNIDFVISDAELVHFNKEFDVITCQYALFFFPNSHKALLNTKKLLRKKGTLAISVHGNNVPFFTSILDVAEELIPDYTPKNTPDLDRFASKEALHREVSNAGFSKIKINEFTFRYSPGTFSDYWNNYLRYVAKPIKEKLDKLSTKQRKEMREKIKQNTLQYTKKNGNIVFPWNVLVLTATK